MAESLNSKRGVRPNSPVTTSRSAQFAANVRCREVRLRERTASKA